MNTTTDVVEAIPQSVSITVPLTDAVRSAIMNVGEASAIAQAYLVESPELASAAQEEITSFQGRIKRLETMRDDLAAEPKKTLEKIRNWFNPAIGDLDAGIRVLKGKISEFLDAERKRIALENAKREEEARRARQEAEAKAAAERARAEQIAAEARRKAEEAEQARRKAEAEGNARAAQAAAAASAKAQEQAQAALENGATKATEALLAAAAIVTAAAPTEAPKVSGFQERDNWVGELKPGVTADQAKDLIIAAAAAGNGNLRALLELDLSAINKLAKALKTSMDVPGFVAVNRPIAASSKRRA